MSSMEEDLLKHLSTLEDIPPNDLTHLCHVIVQHSGYTSYWTLLKMSTEEQMDFFDTLEDHEISRKIRKQVREWLKASKENGPFSHFYKLDQRLNFGRTSSGTAAAAAASGGGGGGGDGNESSTVIRVDIDPMFRRGGGSGGSSGGGGIPAYSLQIPSGAIDKQIQLAREDYTPVVSMIGPTGVGKSLLSSSFMNPHDNSRNKWPIVASPNQHVPTSANVSVHRGCVFQNLDDPIVLFDYEGEDGRTPKSLVDKGRQTLLHFAHLFQDLTPDTNEQQQDTIDDIFRRTEAGRTKVVKRILPPLAYLLSDVIVFIDQGELRQTRFRDRIAEFAGAAYRSVESMSWRPALIIVQNKWIRQPGDIEEFDVTRHYDWMVNSLAPIFQSVRLIRIPAINDKDWFVSSMITFHDLINSAIQQVRNERKSKLALYSERIFWFHFHSMIKQFNAHATLKATRDGGASDADCYVNFDTIVASHRTSRHPADNALKLLQAIGKGSLPKSGRVFQKALEGTLRWYAYSLAGEARYSGNQDDARQGLRSVYDAILKVCLPSEPCNARLTYDGKTHVCTQRRGGHLANSHSNPILLKKPTTSVWKFVVSFGLWKDQVPCIWSGAFEPSINVLSFTTFQNDFESYLSQGKEDYDRGIRLNLPKTVFSDAETDGLCFLCLRAGQDLIVLPCEFRHPICYECVLNRKTTTEGHDEVVCPFCHQTCKVSMRGLNDDNGFRILSLEGGGIRGLVQVLVLQQIEHHFHPLHITQLFDVIIGTNSGGVLAMALMTGMPISKVGEFWAQLAREYLDIDPFQRIYRVATGQPVYSSLSSAMKQLFGANLSIADYRTANAEPPYVFTTSYNKQKDRLWLMGNFPSGWDIKSPKFVSSPFAKVWHAARATFATPGYFAPLERTTKIEDFDDNNQIYFAKQTFEFIDGGIVASCPAKTGVYFAREYGSLSHAQRGNFIESIVSIGTGSERMTSSSSSVTPRGNILTLDKEAINIATAAKDQWEREIIKDPSLQNIPKVRINPPNIGSLDPFHGKSLDGIREEMASYFDNDQNNIEVLYHILFAKLWELPVISYNPMAGEKMTWTFELRRDLYDFSKSDHITELRKIIRDRWSITDDDDDNNSKEQQAKQRELMNMTLENLRLEANAACRRKPLVHPLDGKFVCIVDMDETIIDDNTNNNNNNNNNNHEKKFEFQRDEAGSYILSIVWRNEICGDVPICGSPKLIVVVDEEK